MTSLIVALLSWIHATAGYEVPATLPTVQFVSHQVLVDTMCNGVDCSVAGMYLYGDSVYLDDRLDVENDPFHRSILLHELVHYVQRQSGRFTPPSCATWLAAEREAYRLQARWLGAEQVAFPVLRRMPRADACEADGRPPEETARDLAAGSAAVPVPQAPPYGVRVD
jgi:hypothetical protein